MKRRIAISTGLCFLGTSMAAFPLCSTLADSVVQKEGYYYHERQALKDAGTFESVAFFLTDLNCVQATEDDGDEVYVVSQWKDSFGSGWTIEPLNHSNRGGDGDPDTEDKRAWAYVAGKKRHFGSDGFGGGVSLGSSVNIKRGQSAQVRVIFFESEDLPLTSLEDYLKRVPLGDPQALPQLKDQYVGGVRWTITNNGDFGGADNPRLLKDTKAVGGLNRATKFWFSMNVPGGGSYTGRIVTHMKDLTR